MQVRKFVARTLPEALAQVRTSMGSEALILHSRPFRTGKFFGWLGPRLVEVVAAADDTDFEKVAAEPQPLAPAFDEMQAQIERLGGLMGQVLNQIDMPVRISRLSSAWRRRYTQMVENGVVPDLAEALVREAVAWSRQSGAPRDAGLTHKAVASALSGSPGEPVTIQLAGPSPRIAAFVGPTGVGKTTTLAKLAARFALDLGARVAVLTADTYRIAAIEQLRTYCDIIGVPLAVVQSPPELALAVRGFEAYDLLLVDTAGRSHTNTDQMTELQALIAELQPDELYLVLSLTMSLQDAEAAAGAFNVCRYNRLLLTKLDETTAPGMAYNLAVRCGRPLSYMGTGQNVPEDLTVAEPGYLCRLILGDDGQ